MTERFLSGSRNELRDLMQQRGNGVATAISEDHSSAVRSAAEHILRDPQRLDIRWRDPLAPPEERRSTVIQVLTAAIIEARRGEAPASFAALQHVHSTDEATLLELYDTTIGWDQVQRYFDQPDTTEIKFVGDKVQIFIAGQPPVTIDNPLSLEMTEQRARILAQDANQPLNASEPQRSLALAYGTRVTIVLQPRALRPLLAFRRGRAQPWNLDTLVERQSMNSEVAELLRFFLQARISMLAVGATGSGKTALLETLLNECAGHIITLEDGAQELNLHASRLWTPQVVDIMQQQQALHEALLGTLRQTPDVIAIGECRGTEAGAILALATTDHQVLLTLHAEDAAGALRRLASRATMRGADYEGRFDDALQDTVQNIPLVAVQQYWGQAGRRLITELALAIGIERDAQGNLQPQCVRLAQVNVCPETGAISWEIYARIASDGTLYVNDQPLPERLQRKLRLGVQRRWSSGHVNRTGVDRLDQAVERVTALLNANQPEQALAELRAAWRTRPDYGQLNPLMKQILSSYPPLAAPVVQQAQLLSSQVQLALTARQWTQAQAGLSTIRADLAMLAAPPCDASANWEAHIERGLGAWQAFDALSAQIPFRIKSGALRETLEELDGMAVQFLDHTRLQLRLTARVELITELVQRGQIGTDVLTAAQAQLEAQTTRWLAADPSQPLKAGEYDNHRQ